MDKETKEMYQVGEFAKKASVSIRTLRFYDKKGILKPSYLSEAGYRLYTNQDLIKLQKILALKYLGFTLEEIIEVSQYGTENLTESLQLQLQVIKEKQNHLALVEQMIKEAAKMLIEEPTKPWEKITDIIHTIHMGDSVAKQYLNAENSNIRIQLHKKYSLNKEGWYPWIYRHLNLRSGMKILELGCGDGTFWLENASNMVPELTVLLSDCSAGMVGDAREKLRLVGGDFSYEVFDFHNIPYEKGSFDVVIVNHALFYAKSIDQVLKEIRRVLKKGGVFLCTTYGRRHMKEIEVLTKGFDPRISLSDINLYDIFGLDQGKQVLVNYFRIVERDDYEDSLLVTESQDLMSYILSCHGNQHEVLKNRYQDFEYYLHEKVNINKSLRITKQAGLFQCR